jgi:hypothetical protein
MRKLTEWELNRMTRIDLMRVFNEMQETLEAKIEDVNKYAIELHEMEGFLIAANNDIENYRDWFKEHEHIIKKEIYLKKALLEHGDNDAI